MAIDCFFQNVRLFVELAERAAKIIGWLHIKGRIGVDKPCSEIDSNKKWTKLEQKVVKHAETWKLHTHWEIFKNHNS